MNCSPLVSLVHGFSRQGYWSGCIYIYIYIHTHTHTHHAHTHTHTCTHTQWCANKNLAIGSSGGLRMPLFRESANLCILNIAWWISSYNMRSKNSDVHNWLSWARIIAPAHGCPMSPHKARKYIKHRDFLGGPVVENLPTNAGTQVQSLFQEDSTCLGATKLMCHNYWALMPQLMKRMHPRIHAAQQEKPPQWESHALQLESSRPTHCN